MSDMTLVNLTFGFKERGDPHSLIPLGCLYLVAALEQQGFRVDFRDYQLNTLKNPFKTETFLSFLEGAADIIGISCCSDLLPLVVAAARKWKAERPEATIILGGVGPTGVAKELLENFPFIDIVVKGEGERTVVELMNRLGSGGDLAGIEGLGFRQGEKVYLNPPRPRVDDLDELPLPAYHAVNPEEYQILGLVSARGCPYRCGFCDAAPFWEYRVSRRSLDSVMREIESFHARYPGKKMQFYDETFTLNKARVLELCRRLKEAKLGIQWSVMTRVDLMDRELMAAMSESGCYMVLYGIESGSDRVLQKMGKKYTVKEAKEKIVQSLDYFWVWTPVIWGFPFETMADFEETMTFVAEVTKTGAVPLLYQLAPFPLSPLYAQYKETLRFSRELYDSCHLIHNDEVLNLIAAYPKLFSGYCHYEPGNVPAKYAAAREYGSIPFLP